MGIIIIIICSVGVNLLTRSINEVICHGIPDQRTLEDGDIINSMADTM